MSKRTGDGQGGRMLVALLVGVLLGIVAAELARRLGPRVALAPGHPHDTERDVVEPAGNEASLAGDENRDSVPGNGTAEAPAEYPVKGNERSGIYHVPGGFAYDRTIATIFFRTPEAAERAGYRAAKA